MNCGNASHSPECLCDVVIPHPTGWVDDAIQDMWMGQEIVNLRGYESEWDDESILGYLEDLVYAKDRWSSVEIVPDDIGDDEDSLIRSTIRRRLHDPDRPRIVDVQGELGLTDRRLISVMFSNRSSMTVERLNEFEDDIVNRRFTNYQSIQKKYGLNFRAVQRLHSYWDIPLAEKERSEHWKLVDELLKSQTHLTNVQILRIVTDKLGPSDDINCRKICSRRGYLVQKGLLEPRKK
jgi:hypothetical protein